MTDNAQDGTDANGGIRDGGSAKPLKQQTKTPIKQELLLSLLAVLVIFLVKTGTPWGIGITPDSMQYLDAARSFARGEGLVQFSSQWPPLYPIALAALQWLAGNSVTNAWILNGLAAAASLWILAVIATRSGWRSEFAALFAFGLALQPGFLHIHFLLWSEPLFLVPCLANLLFLDSYLRGENPRAMLLGIIACVCAAVLTRYAGLFLVLLNAFAILFLPSGIASFRRRLAIAILVSIASLTALLGWFVFNRYRGVPATNRELVWHPPGAEHFKMLGHTVARWAHLPDAFGLPLFVALLVGASLLVVRAMRGKDASGPLPGLMGLFFLCYSLFLLASIAFVDFYTPLAERILFPLVPVAWYLALHWVRSIPGRWLRRSAFALLGCILAFGAVIGIADWQSTRTDGIGLTGMRIHRLAILAWLRQLPPDARTVSNGPELFTIYFNSKSTMLPRMIDPLTQQPNQQFAAQMRQALAPPVFIVHFQAMQWRDYLPGPDVLSHIPDAHLLYQDADGMVWVRDGKVPPSTAPATPSPVAGG